MAETDTTAGTGRSIETPYKLNHLVLSASGEEGAYDARAVDCPFVFHHQGTWYMTFVAFDGIGYQTGLAASSDLVHWMNLGCILGRDPSSSLLKYNAALGWILRENDLKSPGNLKTVGGQFIGVYQAYPDQGYEQGPGIIGLAYSTDLLHWDVGSPILHPQDGAAWERGGLYKPCFLEHGGVYYLFYNAKDQTEGPWREQIGVAVSRDLKVWDRYQGNPVIANGGPGSFDERFASDPCVLWNEPNGGNGGNERHGGEWTFFYFGLDANGVARELVATGPDLMHAGKHPRPLIDVGPAGSVDSVYAHKPSVVSHGGDLYHFYCAVGRSGSGGDETIRGISVARSRPWAEGGE
jgi:hypothetical protein